MERVALLTVAADESNDVFGCVHSQLCRRSRNRHAERLGGKTGKQSLLGIAGPRAAENEVVFRFPTQSVSHGRGGLIGRDRTIGDNQPYTVDTKAERLAQLHRRGRGSRSRHLHSDMRVRLRLSRSRSAVSRAARSASLRTR